MYRALLGSTSGQVTLTTPTSAPTIYKYRADGRTNKGNGKRESNAVKLENSSYHFSRCEFTRYVCHGENSLVKIAAAKLPLLHDARVIFEKRYDSRSYEFP